MQLRQLLKDADPNKPLMKKIKSLASQEGAPQVLDDKFEFQLKDLPLMLDLYDIAVRPFEESGLANAEARLNFIKAIERKFEKEFLQDKNLAEFRKLGFKKDVLERLCKIEVEDSGVVRPMIHWLWWNEQVAIIQFLVTETDEAAKLKDPAGNTLLMNSFRAGDKFNPLVSPPILDLLLQKGVNINACVHAGKNEVQTALTLMNIEAKKTEHASPRELLALKMILSGAKDKGKNSYRKTTFLFELCQGGFTYLADLLLKKNGTASLFKTNKNGENPLDVAAKHNQHLVVYRLMKFYATPTHEHYLDNYRKAFNQAELDNAWAKEVARYEKLLASAPKLEVSDRKEDRQQVGPFFKPGDAPAAGSAALKVLNRGKGPGPAAS